MTSRLVEGHVPHDNHHALLFMIERDDFSQTQDPEDRVGMQKNVISI